MPDSPNLARLESALRDSLPPESLGIDTTAYNLDGLSPLLAVFPADAAEVGKVLAIADEAGAAVVPWGGGSHQSLGGQVTRYDLALDLRHLNRVVDYEPADLTVTVEAGIELDALQNTLAEQGQRLPLSPPRSPRSTVGGILATNASGPDRHRYGTARDVLIGISFALPSGEVVKSGGRVVKNVAGYDLGKLQIGALGGLGVITQASFKVAPLPPRTEMVQFDGTLSDLMSITGRCAGSLLSVHGIVLFKEPGTTNWSLQVLLAGGPAAVERSLSEIHAMPEALTVEVDPRLSGPALRQLVQEALVVKAAVAGTSLPTVLEAMVAAGASIAAYPTAGVAYGSWQDADVATDKLHSLRALCSAGGGALVIERAPLKVKQEIDVWGPPPPSFGLMRQLKAEFDPHNVLNPGRYVGGL